MTLSHDRIHAEDCADCETSTGSVSRIRAQISLDGNLDVETRQRIFEIAEKCPVHKTLTGEIKIEADLAD